MHCISQIGKLVRIVTNDNFFYLLLCCFLLFTKNISGFIFNFFEFANYLNLKIKPVHLSFIAGAKQNRK